MNEFPLIQPTGAAMSGTVFTLLAILGAFAVMWGIIPMREEDRARAAVADLLKRFVDGVASGREWSYFIYVAQYDAELEKIRQRCADLPKEFPPASPAEYCGEEGYAVIREYARQLEKKIRR